VRAENVVDESYFLTAVLSQNFGMWFEGSEVVLSGSALMGAEYDPCILEFLKSCAYRSDPGIV